MSWKPIKQHKPVVDKPVLLWGGLIEAEHTRRTYPYSTPVKAYWDGSAWLLSDSVYHGGTVLDPTHVAPLKRPPKADKCPQQ